MRGSARHQTNRSRLLIALATMIVVLLALGMPAQGQGQDLSTLPGQFVTFDRGDGLPDDMVYAVWGASDGTLWAGTAAGLARFDGVAWKDFKSDAHAPTGAVRSVWGDDKGQIWAAGDSGLTHFDGHTWQVMPTETLGLSGGPLYTIWNDVHGELWIGGERGAAHLEGKIWHAFTSQNSGLPAGPVQALTGSADGRFIWFGTAAGLARYEPANDTWLQFAPEERNLTTLSVLSLWLGDETLWAGTESGLVRYDLTTGHATLLDGRMWDGPDGVSGIWSKEGELWLAVRAPALLVGDDEVQKLKRRGSGGLRRFNGSRWESPVPPIDSVNAIWFGGLGIFWFATDKGVSRFDSERWRVVPQTSPLGQRLDVVRGDVLGHIWFSGLNALYTQRDEGWTRDLPPDWSQSLVWALWATRPDDVWIGSDKSGAAHWDGLTWERFTHEYGLAGDSVRAIWADHPGSIWFGTNRGLSHLDRMTGEWKTLSTQTSGLPLDRVTALSGDSQGLWIGTLGGGAARYEPARERWEKFRSIGLVDNDVQALAEDKAGGIWVATTGGVAHRDRISGMWRQWTVANGLPQFDNARDITVTADGIVLLTTAVSGVYRYAPDTDSWTPFAADRLPDREVWRAWVGPNDELWFATQQGSLRYDTQTSDWLTLTARDGLASDDVREIWGDKAGTLWFATRSGVSRLSEGHWQTFTSADGLAGTNTVRLTGDANGNIWAAGSDGLSRYTGGAWNIVLPWPAGRALWRDLYAPGLDRLWVVTPDGVLHYFDGHDWQVITVNSRLTGQLQSVIEDSQGEVWVGSRQGLAQWPTSKAEWSYITTVGLVDNDVHAIWGDAQHYVWFATGHGISRYEIATGDWRSYTSADGLLSDNVTGVWGDDKGHVWASQDEVLGQLEGGVSYFDGRQWSSLPVEGLPSRRVNSLWIDRTGKLWVATMAGPAWWDGNGWQRPSSGPTVAGQVNALWAAADGLWVAADGGVSHFDNEHWQTFTTADGVPAGELRTIWSDGQGGAWVGSPDGLARFDGNYWQTFPPTTLPGEVHVIWGRTANDVWAATNKGVAHFDGIRWQQVLTDEETTTLVGDGQGGLWLGTSHGLRHHDGQKWLQVTDPDLASVAVTDIRQTPNGTTCVSTRKGAHCFGGSEKARSFLGGAVRTLLVDRVGTLWFAEEDGEIQRVDQLPPRRIFSSNVRAMVEDARGDIWFGTDEGLLRYRPRPPIASIQSVNLADGQSIPMAGRLVTLPYRPGKVTITLVATDTASLSKEENFWYRLAPQESDWKRWDSSPFSPPPDKRRQVSYENLEPGNYTFYLAIYNLNHDSVGRQAWTISVTGPSLVQSVRENPAFPWALGTGGLLLGGSVLLLWQTRRAVGYRDAELVVQAAAEGKYQVTWRGPRGARASYTTQPARDLLEPFLVRVAADHTSGQELRQMGELLFSTLWNEQARQRLLQGTATGRKGWRLRLNLTAAPELLILPWEYAYGGPRLGFLGVNPNTALVRYLPPDEPPGRPKTQKPLEILVVWAEPQDQPSVEVEQEVAAIQAALQPLKEAGRLRIRTLGQATPAAFSQAVITGADVVHFIGHGGMESQHGVLYLEDGKPNRGSVPLTDDELATMFRGGLQAARAVRKIPSLVVLSACRSGAVSQGARALAGLAPVLLRQTQVPAVVGMQYPVGADVAARFAEHFYRTLLNRGGGQVDYAISVARKALYPEKGAMRRDWGAAVLYMQVADGRIFEKILGGSNAN